MMEAQARPRLKAGCRLSPSGDVLLIPEGALKLQGPARRILEACDGERTVPQIVAALLADFSGAEPAKVFEETASFLKRLSEKGAIEWV